MISVVEWALAAALVASPASAPAEESELDRAMREAAEAFGGASGSPAEVEAAPRIQAVKSETEVNGYVMDRFTWSWVDLESPVASRDIPQIVNLMEANVQLRRPLWREAFAYVDVSAFFQQGGWFVEKNADGKRVNAAPHDVLTLRPSLALSEAYLSYSPIPNLNLMIGKRRIVWGPGMANNPTDLLNPPRDPSDPNLQRTGAIVARVEVPTEYATFSLVASPQVLYTENGLPYQFLKYPSYAQRATLTEQQLYPMPPPLNQRLFPDVRDTQFHYMLAARVYALILNSDVNFIYYFSNLYNDAFRNKSRVGVTFSRYFFTHWELHVEALFTEGTQRVYVNGECVDEDVNETLGCLVSGTPVFARTKLNNGIIYPRVLTGIRRAFSDESTLSLEYLWVGDGYTPVEFQNFVRGVIRAGEAGISPTGGAAGPGGGAIIPRFSFDPLRRHYLFLTYTKPKIKDDWTVNGVLIADLEDLSAIVIPSVTWNALEWLNLQLGAFVPIKWIPVNQAKDHGRKYSEYSMFPYDVRVFLEARAFY